MTMAPSPWGLGDRGSRFSCLGGLEAVPSLDLDLDEGHVACKVALDAMDEETAGRPPSPAVREQSCSDAERLQLFWADAGFPSPASRVWERGSSSTSGEPSFVSSVCRERLVEVTGSLRQGAISSPTGIRLSRPSSLMRPWRGPLPPRRQTPPPVLGMFMKGLVVEKTGGVASTSSPTEEGTEAQEAEAAVSVDHASAAEDSGTLHAIRAHGLKHGPVRCAAWDHLAERRVVLLALGSRPPQATPQVPGGGPTLGQGVAFPRGSAPMFPAPNFAAGPYPPQLQIPLRPLQPPSRQMGPPVYFAPTAQHMQQFQAPGFVPQQAQQQGPPQLMQFQQPVVPPFAAAPQPTVRSKRKKKKPVPQGQLPQQPPQQHVLAQVAGFTQGEQQQAALQQYMTPDASSMAAQSQVANMDVDASQSAPPMNNGKSVSLSHGACVAITPYNANPRTPRGIAIVERVRRLSPQLVRATVEVQIGEEVAVHRAGSAERDVRMGDTEFVACVNEVLGEAARAGDTFADAGVDSAMVVAALAAGAVVGQQLGRTAPDAPSVGEAREAGHAGGVLMADRDAVYSSSHCGRGSGVGCYITSTDPDCVFFTDPGCVSFTGPSCVSFTDSGCCTFDDPGDRGRGLTILHASTEGIGDGGWCGDPAYHCML
ncbi:hypothetical protein ACQ4PT_013188 [Festuca glaucescens]